MYYYILLLALGLLGFRLENNLLDDFETAILLENIKT